jgi:hypothetical protein
MIQYATNNGRLQQQRSQQKQSIVSTVKKIGITKLNPVETLILHINVSKKKVRNYNQCISKHAQKKVIFRCFVNLSLKYY